MARIKDDKLKSQSNNIRITVCKQCRIIAFMMLGLLRYLFDLFIDKIFELYYKCKAERVPPPDNPLVLESACSLARKIRKKEVTSEEVVMAFIERIKQVNGMINAIVDDRFEEAVKEAQVIDKDILTQVILDSDFDRQPLLGVPFTTKESTACKGLSSTYGLLSRKGYKASFDAKLVQALKEAGGILIAVTNIPQLNLWQETRNPVYGLTKNPYNTTRNVGGSSGGEASIIAACGSPIGVGTDIGGSLRIPAFMCGLFAHKPTSGIVSTHGLTFRTGKEKNTMVAAGPIARYPGDLLLLYKVLISDNIKKLKLDEEVNMKDIKVFYITDPKDPFISPFREEMKEALTRVVNHFREILPAKPEQLTIKELKYGGKIWRYWMSQEDSRFNRDLANREGEINSITELIKFCVGRSDFNIAIIFYLINELLPKEKEQWARELTDILHKKLTSALGANGVLIYPSAPWPASYHHTALLRPWNCNLFGVWNAMKYPVTQVPIGLSSDGLPLGVQVVACPFQDHLTLAVANELEKAFGGFVPPFRVDT